MMSTPSAVQNNTQTPYPAIAVRDFVAGLPSVALAKAGLPDTQLTFPQTLLIHDKEQDENPVERIQRLRFHIKSDDYFGTLATVLDIILQEKKKKEARHNALLESLRDDLLFLQKHYRIERK